MIFSPFVNYQAIGFNTCNPCLYGVRHNFPAYVFRGSMSYVTGTHSFKVGFNTRHAEESHGVSFMNNPLRYEFATPEFPFAVTQFGTPRNSHHISNDLGIYAQDQWTIDRLTLNLGVRYDHVNAYYPAQSHPGDLALEYFGADATRFVSAFDVERRDNVPNYHDIVPRLGAAYDLFGDGRTAIKATLGKYVLPVGTSIAEEVNPLNALQLETRRRWFDLPFQGGNGNFRARLQLRQLRGQRRVRADRGSPVRQARPDAALRPRPARGLGDARVSSGRPPSRFSRRWPKAGRSRSGTSGPGTRTTSSPTTSSSVRTTSIPTTSSRPRIRGWATSAARGSTASTTITPEALARGRDNLVTLARDLPGGDVMGQWFNGVDFTFNGRLDNGVTLGGGVSTGSLSYNECFVIDNPQQARPGYCDLRTPWSSGTQVKFNGAVPLPYDTQVSFVFQNLAGRPWESLYQAGQNPVERVLIEQQLGRPMAVAQEEIQLFPAGSGSASVTLGDTFNFTGSTFYEKRLSQLDLRLTEDLPRRQRADSRLVRHPSTSSTT